VKAIFIVSVFLLFYTYFFYPLILVIISKLKVQRPQPKAEVSCPGVSMVVAAYNEEKVIKEKIENFLSLDYPPEKIELVIGSDGSTDGTADRVRPFMGARVRLFEFSKRRGKAAVLNDIVKEAQNRIILFSDADTMYDREAVLKLGRHFSDGSTGGVCGRLTLSETAGSLVEEGLYWRYENFIKEKESSIKTIAGINGQIFAVRRELFEDLPEDAIAEDQVTGVRIIGKGYRILFETGAAAHERAGTMREEFERRARISAGNFQSIAYSMRALNPASGFSSFALWSHKVLRWCAPFLLIAAFLSNMALVRDHPFAVFFYAQVVFYLISISHCALNKYCIDVPLFRVAAYFTLMNAAILAGFFRFITGAQKVTWNRKCGT